MNKKRLYDSVYCICGGLTDWMCGGVCVCTYSVGGTLLCVLSSHSGDSGLQCLLRIEGKSPSLCIQITLAAVAVKRWEIK